MGMHTIRVVYDPTTRRISLAQGTDSYGGATTDVDSVNIIVTGIVPEGEGFAARVDFAVFVKDPVRHTVFHPYAVLVPDDETITESTEWTAVIPNTALRATEETHKLPIQLVLTNDTPQVINSRNTLVLETTRGIDAKTGEMPKYEIPEWPTPTGIATVEEVHTVDLTYDPITRTLSLTGTDTYGGATIDTNSVMVNILGISSEYDARLDFATAVRMDNDTVVRPFVVLDRLDSVFRAMIPQPVLMSTRDTKKLPFQLVLRHGDTIINSRNTIVLEVTRAINAMENVEEIYGPYVMYRNDTWEWIEDFTYDTGAVVVYNGEMYTSLIDDNLGLTPSEHSEVWNLLTGVESVVIGGIEGTRTGSTIVFTNEQVATLVNNVIKLDFTPMSLEERTNATGTVTYDD